MKVIIEPFGASRLGPSDDLARRCASILTRPSEARDRLNADVFRRCGADAVAQLERSFDLTIETERLRPRLREAKSDSIDDGLQQGVIVENEAERLRAAESAVFDVIAVDDFEPRELSPLIEEDRLQWPGRQQRPDRAAE